MDKLPQELVNHVVSFCERYPDQQQWSAARDQYYMQGNLPSQFPRLAILSRHWKEAIEIITFRNLSIKSNELDTLYSMVTGNRRKYLTKIEYEVLLPEYSEDSCTQEKSRYKQRVTDEVFTKGIYDLFKL